MRIDGIRLSGRQALVTIPPASSYTAAGILRQLAVERINLTFISLDSGQPGKLMFCLDEKHRSRTCAVLQQRFGLLPESPSIPSVGLLTVFPHRSRTALIGQLLKELGRGGFVVHAFCSSISALTLVLDYRSLDQVSSLLRARYDVPGGGEGPGTLPFGRGA